MADPRKSQPTDREMKAAVYIGEVAELDPKSDFALELAYQSETLGLLDTGSKTVKSRLHHMTVQAKGDYTMERAQAVVQAMLEALSEGESDEDDAQLPAFQYEALVAEPDLTRLFQYLPQADIEWRQGASTYDGSKVQMLPYVTARAVMRILNETFGLLGWRAEYTPVANGFICRLWVFYGGEWHFKEDGASTTNIEPVKGGISDALKRAGSAWGIAQYLYYTDKVWVPANDKKVDWKAARPLLVVKINGEKVGE